MDQLITRHDIDITRPGPMQAGDPDRPVRLKVGSCYMDLTETNAATIGQRLIDASDPDHAAELAATHRPIDLNDLTPRPTDPAHGHTQHAWMRKQLNRYSCHGLAMTVDPTGIDGSATLVVAYTAADSRRPGHEIALKARRAIGPYPTLDETAFARDLRNALLHGVFAHELDEHLTRDGKLLNDPHTDPTRWHCHHCGGVGPTRHEGNQWRCPECGQLTTLPDTTKIEQTGQSPEAPGAGLGSSHRAQDELDQADRDAFRRLARRMGPAAFDAAYNAVMAVPAVTDDPRRENGRVWRAVEAALDGWAIVPDPRAIANPAAAAAPPGDVTVIGPECFASNDGAVICWRGRNYVPQSDLSEAIAAHARTVDGVLAEGWGRVAADGDSVHRSASTSERGA